MFRHLSHTEINRQHWDALITEAPSGLIYALSWYLDIVSPGWEALVKQEGGRYVAVLPLPVRRKFGLRYLQQPLFTQQLGLVQLAPPTTADWAQVGSLLTKKFSYISKYAFNRHNATLASPATLGMGGVLSRTYHLSLRASYAALWEGYRPERRRHLRKAQVYKLVVEPSANIDLLLRIFDENTAHRLTGVLGEAYEYPMLRRLYRAASQAGLGTLWQVRTPQGEVLAMMFLLHYKRDIIYLFNSSTKAGKEMGAVSVMIDEFLRQHAEQDLCFDFESPGVPSLERFYGSFGSVAVPYFYVSNNQLPWPVRQLKAARMSLYRRLRPRPAPGNDAG
jgi:hypothetical protein